MAKSLEPLTPSQPAVKGAESTKTHTPGPWRVDAVFPDVQHGQTFEPFAHEFKARVRLADIPDVVDEESEEMANAHLISAAPELLAELQHALRDVESRLYMLPIEGVGEQKNILSAQIGRYKAAIDKAVSRG